MTTPLPDTAQIHSAKPSPLLGIFSYLIYLFLSTLYILYLPNEIESLVNRSNWTRKLTGSIEYVDLLQKHQAKLDRTKKDTIPPLFPLNIPSDLSRLPLKQKTEVFLNLVLPGAIKANESILHLRRELIRLHLSQQQGLTLNYKENQWLKNLATSYSSSTDIPSLLHRVDIIPISLTIAQAIMESGWGSSRFAMKGNGLYGQHLSKNSKGNFILSLQGNVKVAAFDSIDAATKSYMHTLNTSLAYRKLRDIRATLRKEHQNIDGIPLASGLKHYSGIGEKYIVIIQRIIKRYKLTSLDGVTFSHDVPPLDILFAPPKKQRQLYP